jgi:6-pyruvoyltetrahydropterin/6-carboxytetrahydropterin synthase
MISVTRKLHFDAAHRVMDHESKCKYLHGHRYVVEATFSAPKLDTLGRIIDFGVIKERLGEWINHNWDHNTILYKKDAELGAKIQQSTQQEIFYLPTNPTVENLAAYLMEVVCPELFKEKLVQCTSIRIYETPNCYSEIQHYG